MSLDLLNELEKRVQSAVNTIEDLKQEIEQLKDENAALTSDKDAWEGRLAELLGKFDLIDSAESDTAEDATAFTAEEGLEELEEEALNEELQEETLANQAFEQDFAEATKESEQGTNVTNNNSF